MLSSINSSLGQYGITQTDTWQAVILFVIMLIVMDIAYFNIRQLQQEELEQQHLSDFADELHTKLASQQQLQQQLHNDIISLDAKHKRLLVKKHDLSGWNSKRNKFMCRINAIRNE